MTGDRTVESAGDFTHVKPGDTVLRDFAGSVRPLLVTSVDAELIYTGGGWRFDRRTGFEDDPDLGVGWRFGFTISRLIKPEGA